MFRSLTIFMLSALTLCLPLYGQQAVSMEDLLAGKVVPLSLKAGDMKEGWRTVSIAEKLESQYYLLFREAGETAKSECRFFTKGETITTGGKVYLIAYRLPLLLSPMEKPVDDGHNKTIPLTADTALALALIDTSTIGNMLDIIPFTPELMLKSSHKQSLNNLRQISAAIQMYMQDHGEMLPSYTNWDTCISIDGSLLFQPVTKEPYVYNKFVADVSLGGFSDPSVTMILWEATPDEDGQRCVAYLDGHVAVINEYDWQRDHEFSARELSKSRLRELAHASLEWAKAHGGQFPSSATWKSDVTTIRQDEAVQPLLDKPYIFSPSLSRKSVKKVADPTTAILAWEPEPGYDGSRCVAFADGHVSVVSEEYWRLLVRLNGLTRLLGIQGMPPAGGVAGGAPPPPSIP